MRTVTANAAAVLSQKMGSEWIVLLEVDWVDGNTITYSDQDFEDAKPVIVEMGGFDGSMQLSGSGDSQELNFTLDDVDEHLRAIYNSSDMHKRPARAYLQPKGYPSSDRILIFQGEVVTPLSWDDQQRTMSFNVLSKLNERQIGFSMEEGDFPNIPDEALGKAWPLVFGQVCHLPAVKVRAPRRGYLQQGVGIVDPTLDERICQAVKIQCPSNSTGNNTYVVRTWNNQWDQSAPEQKTVGPDLSCVNQRFSEICKLRDLLNQQKAYVKGTVSIYNGISFPQNQNLRLFVDDAILVGRMTGNSFRIYSRIHPEASTYAHQRCRNVPVLAYTSVEAPAHINNNNQRTQVPSTHKITNNILEKDLILKGNTTGQSAWDPNSTSQYWVPNQNDDQAFRSCDEALGSTTGMSGGPKTSWDYYNALESSSFFWAPPGSEVYMESESEILYIVSLILGTVDKVCAYRTAPNGFRYLTEVPASYYTVYNTDYDGYEVVEIGMNKSLTLYNDQWEDEIYVSFTSLVGPNPCDTIAWLVDKYTDLTIDSASFVDVKAKLTNYPKNFYITERPDVYQLINDIAYQSRCAVYIRNGVIFIKYLSEEPTSVRTITKSDILAGSFEESLSDTEEVYTTHNIKWQKGGATVRDDQDVERKIILKYNVGKYGTVEDEWDYYTDNLYETNLKTATFWLIRKANSWKKVRFSLPLKHLDLDVLDCIELDFDQFSTTPVKCIIETMLVDPDSNTIDVTCWTPIRSGESEPYYWAWPAAQAATAKWPLPGDDNGGGGYNFEVTPPIGHILLGGAHHEDQLVITTGDENPSDLDDTLPVVVCEQSNYLGFNNEQDPKIIAKEAAASAANNRAAAVETNQSGGGNPSSGGSGGDSKKRGLDECGTGTGCNYKVTVQWHTSAAQGLALVLGGSAPGGPCGGPCGCEGGCLTCFGSVWDVCYTYSSPNIAKQAALYWASHYGKRANDWWNCRETRIVAVWVGVGTHDGDTTNDGADCEDLDDADVPNPDGTLPVGESQIPVGLTGNEPTHDEMEDEAYPRES